MVEQFGLQVSLELALKNLKEVEKKVKDALGKVDVDAISRAGAGAERAGGVAERAGAARGQAKKQTGLLGGILTKLGPLAVLLSLKPVADLIQILTNFIILAFLKVWSLLKDLGNLLKDFFPKLGAKIIELKDRVVDWFSQLLDTVREKLSDLKESIKDKFERTINFIKSIPSRIWNFIKEGFKSLKERLGNLKDRIVEKLILLKDKIVEFFGNLRDKIVELKERIGEKLSELRDRFVERVLKVKEKITELKEKLLEKIIELREKFVNKLTELKNGFFEKVESVKAKLIEIKESIVTWFTDLVQKIVGLPQKIWDKVKELGTIISDKVKGLIPFRRGGSETVDDALITKGGKIVKFNPEDNIFATKGDLRGGSGGTTNTFNFFGMTVPEAIEQIKRELGEETFLTTRIASRF